MMIDNDDDEREREIRRGDDIPHTLNVNVKNALYDE